MDSHWLRVCVLCCVVLSAKNTAVLGQVEDEDVCEEHYKRCQDDNYCSYMFDIRRQTDESCPEFSQLQTNLRDIQNRIQKQADTLEEAIVDFEEHKQGQFDLYEKLQEQQQQLWVQSEKLERHWQWIERQQKQIDIANDLIGEWHAHVEEMWDHMEGQSWVQQLRYQVERQQYDFKVLQQQVTAQQQEMDEQQDDWEKQQSSMWSDMQDWLMDHQNSLIESIKLAQEPLANDPIIQQQWEVISRLQDENYEQQNNMEKYQEQIVCLEDSSITMNRKLQEMVDPYQLAPVLSTATPCTRREMLGYFHRYNAIIEFNETKDNPPRDVVEFQIDKVQYVAFIYGEQCEIFTFKNHTFSPHQVIEFEDQSGYEKLNHFGVYFEIEDRQMLVIGHASSFGHIVYIWLNSRFVQFQLIQAQDKGVKEWDFTTVKDNSGTKYFLAVSVNRQKNGKYVSATNSTIYAWNGYLFVKYQDIETHGARTVTFFEIDGATYLAVGFSYLLDSDDPYSVYTKIYKYNSSKSKFVQYETLPIPGWTTSIVAFHDKDEFYLLDLKFMDVKGSYNTKSPLYMWNEETESFHIHQNITTQGAMKACPFYVEKIQYFVVMNSWGDDGANKDDSCMVHRRNGDRFVPWQVLEASIATTCAAFIEDNKLYLVARKSVYKLQP